MSAWRITVLVAAGLAGCGGGGDERGVADSLIVRAFARVPLFPGAGISEVSGEGEAARATLHIRRPADSVAAWYRRALLASDWSIVSDVRTPDGVVTLHATDRNRRPIWLLVGSQGSGTVVTVVGAVPAARDSAGQ
jgi:hypothetical protein